MIELSGVDARLHPVGLRQRRSQNFLCIFSVCGAGYFSCRALFIQYSDIGFDFPVYFCDGRQISLCGFPASDLFLLYRASQLESAQITNIQYDISFLSIYLFFNCLIPPCLNTLK